MKGVIGRLVNDGAMFGAPEQSAPIFKQCAHCGAPIKITPVVFSNTTVANLWSDSYLEAADLPEPPVLGKCRACGAIGCPAELDTIEEVPQTVDPSDHAVLPLTLDDYTQLLDNLDNISEQFHTYLRVRFWQLNNHRRRGPGPVEPLSEAERANMMELLKLLGTGDAERLMAAEILRQLRDFEAAEMLLSGSFDEAVMAIVERQRKLVKGRNTRLVKLFSHALEQ